MKTIYLLLIGLVVSHYSSLSQNFSGAFGIASIQDEYLLNLKVVDGDPCSLIQGEIEMWPRTNYHYINRYWGESISLNGSYSNLTFNVDTMGHIYVAGIQHTNFLEDSAKLFLVKLDELGVNQWTLKFNDQTSKIEIFIDRANNIYLYYNHYLNKFNQSGGLLWRKEHSGILKYENNVF